MEKRGDVLAIQARGEVGEIDGTGWLRGRDVEDYAMHAEEGATICRPDAEELGVRLLVFRTEHPLETDCREPDHTTEDGDDEAKGYFLPPRLAHWLVLEAANCFEKEIGGPEGDDPGKYAPCRRSVVVVLGWGCGWIWETLESRGVDERDWRYAALWPREGLCTTDGGPCAWGLLCGCGGDGYICKIVVALEAKGHED